MRKKRISVLMDGDEVDDIFVVKIKKAVGTYKNGFRLDLVLSDETGESIDYTYWGPNDEAKVNALFDSIHKNSVLHVKGTARMYRNELNISSGDTDAPTILREGEYDVDAFIPSPKRDIEETKRELAERISAVKNTGLKRLLDSIFTPSFIESYSLHPAGIQYHHSRKGGMVQHALEMCEFCDVMCRQHPSLDHDLLITGVLVHDIGKMEEIKMGVRIEGTVEGQLLGHLAMSALFVSKKCDEVGLPQEMRNKLIHMILSHHGKLEWGSPKEPMFPEALALHHADMASAMLDEMVGFVEESRSRTTDETNYSRRLKRNILLK